MLVVATTIVATAVVATAGCTCSALVLIVSNLRTFTLKILMTSPDVCVR